MRPLQAPCLRRAPRRFRSRQQRGLGRDRTGPAPAVDHRSSGSGALGAGLPRRWRRRDGRRQRGGVVGRAPGEGRQDGVLDRRRQTDARPGPPRRPFTLVRQSGFRYVLDGRFTSATSVSAVFAPTLGCGTGSPISGQLVWPDAGNALAPGQTEPVVEYVALGDSYASGEGVDPYTSDTKNRLGCHRSTRAYSELVRATGVTLRRRSFACSGAVTANVGLLGSDGSVTGKIQRTSEGAIQLDRLTEADWRQVGLVTITIGGNDARFEPVLAECTVVACERGRRAERIERRVTNLLPSFLARTYAAIARRAPQATVVVVGYPRLFPGPGQAQPWCFANKLPRVRQLFLNRVSSQLRDVIARRARRAGLLPRRRAHVRRPRAMRAKGRLDLRPQPRARPRGGQRQVLPPQPRRSGGLRPSAARFLSCIVTSGAALQADGLPANPGPGRAAPAGCTPN